MENEDAWFSLNISSLLEEDVDIFVEHIIDDELDTEEYFGRWLDTYLLLEEVLSK